jgi:hypothetical protein
MAFKVACQGGSLSMAQWLYSLGRIDIHDKDDEAFVGHVEQVIC